MRTAPICGTRSGYVTHVRKKELICEPCKEASREYIAAYREQNKNQIAETMSVWMKANKDKVNASSRKWRANNPEKRKEVVKAYWAANPEKRRETVRRRRATRLNNYVEKYTEQEVLDRYGTDCHICSKPIDLTASRRSGIGDWEFGLHVDHLIPICNNGDDTLDNVRPTHAKCNLVKNRFESKEITNGNY